MKESQHTTTPLTVRVRLERIDIVTQQDGAVVEIAQVHHLNWHGARLPAEANARLFATAPDLLLLLQEAVARIEIANAEGAPTLSAWLLGARTAIAACKGKHARKALP